MYNFLHTYIFHYILYTTLQKEGIFEVSTINDHTNCFLFIRELFIDIYRIVRLSIESSTER